MLATSPIQQSGQSRYSISTSLCLSTCLLFFFNDTATTEIYTLSLHDALPILTPQEPVSGETILMDDAGSAEVAAIVVEDRKSTRLNSSHQIISYAVFCLKKKKRHPNGPSPFVRPKRTRSRPPPDAERRAPVPH